jgi:hypothetical protein
MIRLWPIAVGWRIIPSRNLSFTKNNFGWNSEALG